MRKFAVQPLLRNGYILRKKYFDFVVSDDIFVDSRRFAADSQLFAVDSRLFAVDSRLFTLDCRLLLSTLDFYSRLSTFTLDSRPLLSTLDTRLLDTLGGVHGPPSWQFLGVAQK
jgi:hypothetical protein